MRDQGAVRLDARIPDEAPEDPKQCFHYSVRYIGHVFLFYCNACIWIAGDTIQVFEPHLVLGSRYEYYPLGMKLQFVFEKIRTAANLIAYMYRLIIAQRIY